MTIRGAPLLAAALLAGPLSASGRDDLYPRLSELNAQGRTLAGVRLVEDRLAAEKSPGEIFNLKTALAQQMTFTGQYRQAIDLFATTRPPPSSDEMPSAGELAQATPVSAMAAIIAEARKHRVVIINESHIEGAGRAFNRLVVRALAPLGFRYLAAETLGQGVERANRDHRILRSLGYFSSDPVYAAMLRSAWASGYQLVRYEAGQEDRDKAETPCDRRAEPDWVAKVQPEGMQKVILWREKQEACNLAQTLADVPAGAKLLVVVGHSHLRKTRDPQGLYWMASFLGAYSGENILAIDQTVEPVASLGGETVFRKPDGTYLLPKSLGDTVDMAVYRPNPRDRGSWWRPDDELRRVMIDAPDKKAGWPVGLVSAVPRGDDLSTVPLDSFYVEKPGMRQVPLLLPEGPADIWFESADGPPIKLSETAR